MLMIRCYGNTQGLRSDERTVVLHDAQGKKEFLRLDLVYLYKRGSEDFLPVTVLHEDRDKDVILIELPHESEGGTSRLWIKRSNTIIHKESISA